MIASAAKRVKPRRSLRQRGLLTVLGFVFAVSATLRIGSLDFANAEVSATPAAATVPSQAINGISAGPLIEALADIEALRDQLDAREAVLVDRENAVSAAQALVEDRLAALEAAEARLTDLVALSDQAAETDLERLTRVYETMAPAQAAPLFAQMSPSFAAGFVARMSPDTGAALMAEMDPEVAYAISVILATRNASAPRLRTANSEEDTEN
ncbi:MAG: hypothetical protein KJP02_12675 [Octadecabacter sp.]|nr:hypothetical protein [Octadecabacter sp.]